MEKKHINPEDLAVIEQYLQDELTGKKRDLFLRRMDQEPGFREKVQEVRLLLLGIAESSLEEKLDHFHKDSITSVPGKRVRLVYPAIAASLLLLVSLGVWWLSREPHREHALYTAYYKPDPGLMTVMSAEEDNYDFERAMVAYKNEEYDKAISIWKPQLAGKPGNDTLVYFLGAAYQARGHSDSALYYIREVAGQSASAFYKDANWYLALLYIRMGKNDEARECLSRSGHSKSGALLKQLGG